MIDYRETCLQICAISKSAATYIATQSARFSTGLVEQKGSHDYVSYVDRTVEAELVASLRNLLPEAGFITEEGTATEKGDIFNWVIDPLDGTTNFIHGVPVYSISIALMENDAVVIGVVHEINRDECFCAWKGGHAMLNNNEIKVSGILNLDSALLATGFPYNDQDRLDEYLDVFRYFAKNTAGLRRLGSAAVDLAYVACGRFEGFYEYELNPWDVAAGAFIVQMAGGRVTDFKGGSNFIFGREMLAASPVIHPEMLTVIQQFFIPRS